MPSLSPRVQSCEQETFLARPSKDCGSGWRSDKKTVRLEEGKKGVWLECATRRRRKCWKFLRFKVARGLKKERETEPFSLLREIKICRTLSSAAILMTASGDKGTRQEGTKKDTERGMLFMRNPRHRRLEEEEEEPSAEGILVEKMPPPEWKLRPPKKCIRRVGYLRERAAPTESDWRQTPNLISAGAAAASASSRLASFFFFHTSNGSA